MKDLNLPYTRSDMAMIRRAFKNGWTIDAATRAEIVAELRRSEQSGEGSASYRKVVVATLCVTSQ